MSEKKGMTAEDWKKVREYWLKYQFIVCRTCGVYRDVSGIGPSILRTEMYCYACGSHDVVVNMGKPDGSA